MKELEENIEIGLIEYACSNRESLRQNMFVHHVCRMICDADSTTNEATEIVITFKRIVLPDEY